MTSLIAQGKPLGGALNEAKASTALWTSSAYTGSVNRMFLMYHLLGDPTLQIWTESPYDYTVSSALDNIHVEEDHIMFSHAANGATVTAFEMSLTGAGLVPLGRATVKDGAVTLPYLRGEQRPASGAHLQFAISHPHARAVKAEYIVP